MISDDKQCHIRLMICSLIENIEEDFFIDYSIVKKREMEKCLKWKEDIDQSVQWKYHVENSWSKWLGQLIRKVLPRHHFLFLITECLNLKTKRSEIFFVNQTSEKEIDFSSTLGFHCFFSSYMKDFLDLLSNLWKNIRWFSQMKISQRGISIGKRSFTNLFLSMRIENFYLIIIMAPRFCFWIGWIHPILESNGKMVNRVLISKDCEHQFSVYFPKTIGIRKSIVIRLQMENKYLTRVAYRKKFAKINCQISSYSFRCAKPDRSFHPQEFGCR